MRQAKNLTTGKVHLVTGENTYCGIKDVEDKVTLLLTECEEISANILITKETYYLHLRRLQG